MRILCVSDHKDPLVYTNSVAKRFPDLDLILGAGDLDLSYYEFLVSSLNLPLGFVFGNHNLQGIERYWRRYELPTFIHTHEKHLEATNGITYLGGRCIHLKGLLLAGLGGCMRYNKGPNQFTEFGMALFSLRIFPRLIFNRIFHGRYLDILVTHAPPAGIHDKPDLCHRGFKFFLWFMRVFKPAYLVHGHIHLYDPKETRHTLYHQTEVINAYNHYLIDFSQEKPNLTPADEMIGHSSNQDLLDSEGHSRQP